MLKSYFTISLRNLVKNKSYTIINTLGLALGISICTIIFLLVKYEMDYDSFHSKSDRIYRIVSNTTNASGSRSTAEVPYPMGPAVREGFSDLDAVTQIHWDYEAQINIGDELFYQDGILFADSVFFDVFDFEVLIGNPRETLKQKHTVLLTESMAIKYFGSSEKAMGQNIQLSNEMDLEVKGILADPPKSNHLPFEMVVSYSSLTDEHVGGFPIDAWGVTLQGYSYLVLPPQVNPEQFGEQLTTYIHGVIGEEWAEDYLLALQPLNEVHFDQEYADSSIAPTSNVQFLLTLGLIGFFIIVLGSINFINLSTALSFKRSKEVGIRKVMGAQKNALILQFLGDSAIITFFSLLLAMGIVERVLGLLNEFLEKDLVFAPFSDINTFLFLLGIYLVVTLLSGVYPAFVLSRFKPIKVLKSSINGDRGKSMSSRKILVSIQFFISQALIVGMIIIIQQLVFFKSQPLGFNSDAVITSSLHERDSLKLSTLKTNLLNNSNISEVSFGVGVPTSENSLGTSMYLGDETDSEDSYRVRIKAVDHDYLKTFNIPLVAGRWYGESHVAASGVVLNETAIKTLGFESPEKALGNYLHLGINHIEAPIIGVVKDFHTKSLRVKIQPVVLMPLVGLYYEAGMRINTSNTSETIEYIRQQWDDIFPGYIFEYTFMDDYLSELYDEENKMLSLAKIAALVSIIIGCMGLYGLISFIAVQRTKEVGIRKALGASVSSIVFQLSKEFIILLGISFVLSVPIVWLSMNQWLETFAYRINMEVWYFGVGFLVTLFISGFT
ncbi:MAG: ABC transporter permease, partial [Bacteroidetes bacterium]|nr:ABC transporter permease [Bacteroidota bacterium]